MLSVTCWSSGDDGLITAKPRETVVAYAVGAVFQIFKLTLNTGEKVCFCICDPGPQNQA